MTDKEYFVLLDTLNYHIENLIDIANNFKYEFTVFNVEVQTLKSSISKADDLEKTKEIFKNFNNRFKIVTDDLIDLLMDKDILVNEMFSKIYEKIRLYTNQYENLSYHIFDYRCIINCFDKRNKEILFPIESKDFMELIYVVVSNNFDCDSHIRIMDYIEKLNNEAINLKSQRVHALDIICKKKKDAFTKIKVQIEDLKQQIFVSADYVLDDEKKSLALKAQNILQENQNLRKSGYTEDVIIGFNLLINSDTIDFNLDPDPNVNMLIALRFIEHYISLINLNPSEELFLKLNKAMNAYDEFKLIILNKEKEKELISKLNDDNSEKLEFAKSIIDELNEFLEEDIKILSYIDSIYSNDKISNEERQKYVSEIISSQNSSINLNKYKLYKMMEEIKLYYAFYISYEEYKSKSYVMSYLNKLLDEYREFVNISSLEDIVDNELYDIDINKEEDDNNILFLPIDGMTGIEKNILHEDKKHTNDFNINDLNSIIYMIKMLKENNIISLQGNAKSVKNKYIGDNIWRLRKGRNRLIYMPISVRELGLPIKKPCILVITAGIKHGEYDIYRYVDSNEVVSALNRFLEEIKMRCAGVRNIKSDRPYEQKEKELNHINDDLIGQSNFLFEQMIQNLKSYIYNGHHLDDGKSKK